MSKKDLIDTAYHLVHRESEFRYEHVESELYDTEEHTKEEIEYILDTVWKLLGGRRYHHSLYRLEEEGEIE